MAKKLNCRQVQWLLYLARFDFILYYCLSKFISKLDIVMGHLNTNNFYSLFFYFSDFTFLFFYFLLKDNEKGT